MTELKKIAIYTNEPVEKEGFVLTYKDRHITEELIRPSGIKRPSKSLFKYSYKGLISLKSIKKLIDQEKDGNGIDIKTICLEAQLRLLTQFSSAYALVQKIRNAIQEEKYNGDKFQPILEDTFTVFKKLNQRRSDLIQYILKNNLYDLDKGIRLLLPEEHGAAKAVFFIKDFYVIFKPVIMRDMEFKTKILNTSPQSKLTPEYLKANFNKRIDFTYVTFDNLEEVLTQLGI
jgi:hypothetical protein